MKRVGVVICNYNKADMVTDCIQAVLENKYEDYDLYVVDNGSTDDSVAAITAKFNGHRDAACKLTLIKNQENLGGSGGFNTGLTAASAEGYEYLMCIDNDAILDENAIGELVRFLDAHPECGMAASKIYHLEDSTCIQNFGQDIDFDHFCTTVPYLNVYDDGTLPDFVYTDSVPACSLMVRSSVCHEIGFLPLANFLYWDDTEWCYLCNKAGHKVASVGSSVALHSMGAKKESVNTFPTYYAWRNWISFFVKYTSIEKLDFMAEAFLDAVFKTQFEGRWKNEKNTAVTVLAAYDDAIHGVTGKATDGKIFPVDKNPSLFDKLFSGKREMLVLENNYPAYTDFLVKKAGEYGCSLRVVADEEAFGSSLPKIFVCETIFLEKLDIELCRQLPNDYIIDIYDCYVKLDSYEKLMEKYNDEKETFLFSQKPLFMRCIKDLRK